MQQFGKLPIYQAREEVNKEDKTHMFSRTYILSGARGVEDK